MEWIQNAAFLKPFKFLLIFFSIKLITHFDTFSSNPPKLKFSVKKLKILLKISYETSREGFNRRVTCLDI